MQRANEKRQNASPKEKEVIAFLGRDCKLYIFDGELPPRLYAEVIPVIKKRKRKKGIARDIVIQCSITCSKDHKLTD